jgi:FkbM family methyltransferase
MIDLHNAKEPMTSELDYDAHRYISAQVLISGLNENGELLLNVTTLDHWASGNSIEKIDFIKADIEGSERYMLKGGSECSQITPANFINLYIPLAR